MSSLLDVRPDAALRGSEQPRIWSFPPAVSSAGDEVSEFVAQFGLDLFPWQRLVLRTALGERADGRWAASEVGLTVPRQNGKGSVIEARELGGLFLLGERTITHTAHEFKTAVEAFRRIRTIIDGSDELTRRVKTIIKMPNPTIELTSGARLMFVARSGGSGRGFSGDVVILDEAYDLTQDQMDALVPTLTTAENPQIWYTSSAGKSHSEVLAKVRRRGVEGSRQERRPRPGPNTPAGALAAETGSMRWRQCDRIVVSLLPQQTGAIAAHPASVAPQQGLTDYEQSLIVGLASKLTTRAAYIDLRWLYYDGLQALQNLGISVPPQLAGVRTVVDWPRAYIDPLVQRAQLAGFRLPNATEVDDELAEHLEANDMTGELPLAILDSLVAGCGYVIVGAPDQPGDSPLVTVESPKNLAMQWDPRTRTAVAAYQSYQVEGIYRAVLYLPNQTISMSRDQSSAWTVDDRDVHNFGQVPVVRLPNRARSSDREGPFADHRADHEHHRLGVPHRCWRWRSAASSTRSRTSTGSACPKLTSSARTAHRRRRWTWRSTGSSRSSVTRTGSCRRSASSRRWTRRCSRRSSTASAPTWRRSPASPPPTSG
jgi:hypothetical protein